MSIAVIGAGIAGAACARRLVEAGRTVVLFDKARGPGGRMSTRRAETPLGTVAFDHGAQYVTARSPAFAEAMEGWRAAGAAAAWRTDFGVWDDSGPAPVVPSTTRWVGAPGMNGLVRAALAGLDVRFNQRVAGLTGAAGAWRLRFENGEEAGPFDAVVCATPAEQVAPLLGDPSPHLAEQAEAAASTPCWTVMAVLPHAATIVYSAMAWTDSPLGWVALQDARPQRAGAPDGAQAWILQANSRWSRQHLEDEPEAVIAALVTAFRARVDAPEPIWTAAHRWRFAQVEHAAGAPFGWDGAQRLATCGDWRLGPRVELAWTSGDALGRALARV